jgi:hypothetical protein
MPELTRVPGAEFRFKFYGKQQNYGSRHLTIFKHIRIAK